MKRRVINLTAGVLLALGGLLGSVPAAFAANPAYGSCQEIARTVNLTAGILPPTATIRGTLCTPTTWAAGAHQVDLLVHGASYNRTYWDWPVDPATYSYVDKTLQSGRATLAYDRLGAGTSSDTPSALVTTTSDAFVMHQLIGYLRGTQGYSTVNIVGHSFGSIVAIEEVATYHDADRLVLTGALHTTGTVFVNNGTSFEPALLDPAFPGELDPGYLTSVPGTRAALFYNSTADPAVIAYDEAHKDKASAAQFADGLAELLAPAATNISQGITVPVLSMVGDQDILFCGLLLTCTQANVQAFEAPFYTHAPSFDAVVVPNTAHDLGLHPSAPATYATINQWILTH
ncbi:MAG TPA: alpha/beta hydrolase [Candidatus Saccharimonadales bacterium]|nr:alpha/beta hydrolase [Candidatus Saccharimonadales bacterium]